MPRLALLAMNQHTGRARNGNTRGLPELPAPRRGVIVFIVLYPAPQSHPGMRRGGMGLLLALATLCCLTSALVGCTLPVARCGPLRSLAVLQDVGDLAEQAPLEDAQVLLALKAASENAPADAGVPAALRNTSLTLCCYRA